MAQQESIPFLVCEPHLLLLTVDLLRQFEAPGAEEEEVDHLPSSKDVRYD